MIQKHVRGKTVRDHYQLFSEKKWNFLFVKPLRIEDTLITFRVIQKVSNGKVYATGVNLFKNQSFNRLELPVPFLKSLDRQYERIFNSVFF